MTAAPGEGPPEDPRRPPDPYRRLRDPEIAARYRSCLLSLLLLSGAAPFLAISYLVIRTVGAYARQAPLTLAERAAVIAAQVVFLWSAAGLVWGLILALRYVRARLKARRDGE